MNNFKEFLTERGVHDIDDLIIFLEGLPDDPEAMVHMAEIEQYQDQIDRVFEIFFN